MLTVIWFVDGLQVYFSQSLSINGPRTGEWRIGPMDGECLVRCTEAHALALIGSNRVVNVERYIEAE